MFRGRYFYRAARGVFDVHLLAEDFGPPAEIFADGFESGDTEAWHSSVDH